MSSDTGQASIWLPIKQIATQVQDGSMTATSMVEQSLSRIKEFDSDYQALISVLESTAREKAAAIDTRVASGETIGVLAVYLLSQKIIFWFLEPRQQLQVTC